MPVAVVNGWDPVLPLVACSAQPPEVCEYDIAGPRQKPVELVKCETVDLEVPANAQIVYEARLDWTSRPLRWKENLVNMPVTTSVKQARSRFHR
jgi:UbiD family decarboxylase